MVKEAHSDPYRTVYLIEDADAALRSPAASVGRTAADMHPTTNALAETRTPPGPKDCADHR